MIRSLLLTFILIGSVVSAQAQCAQTLRLAQSIYEQGRLQDIPPLLLPCLVGDQLSHDGKVAAYKLLTLTYLYLEEPAKADEMMLLLLRTETEFKESEVVDPAEFIALLRTFRREPVFRLGLKTSAVATERSVVSADYIDDGTNRGSHGFGFVAGLSGEIPFTGKLDAFTLNPEFMLQIVAFNGQNEYDQSAERGDTARVTPATERQVWVSLPVSLQYNLYSGQITHYYASLGLSVDYLMSSRMTLSSTREGSSGIEEGTRSLTHMRNRFNSGALASAGVKRKIGKGLLIAEVRFKMGLFPVSSRAHTYADPALVFDYKYVEGINRINSLMFSVGYVINRYNPKKLASR